MIEALIVLVMLVVIDIALDVAVLIALWRGRR